MNDRKNLPEAIKLNDQIERIEGEEALLDKIYDNGEGIDTIVLHSGSRRVSIFASEIRELKLVPEFRHFINQIIRARKDKKRILEEKIKELRRKYMERKCGNCKNIKHTGRFINGAGVYTCDVIRGEVDILSLCNFFDPIGTFREGTPEIQSPSSAGFRGYELSEKSTIKATNGYLIWIE